VLLGSRGAPIVPPLVIATLMESIEHAAAAFEKTHTPDGTCSEVR
jgi:hypothetical protein